MANLYNTKQRVWCKSVSHMEKSKINYFKVKEKSVNESYKFLISKLVLIIQITLSLLSMKRVRAERDRN